MTGAVCASCGQPLRPQARFCAHCGRPLATPPAAGETLRGGDYEIVRSLSKGGMGAIYLARDVRAFGRLCIIKQMLAYYDPSSDEERRRAEERFADEGRTLAFLSHPGIPKIYTFFQEGGCYYLVMEYIEGQNLESFVTRRQSGRLILPTRRLHQEEVVRYAVQLCRILEYLHSQERPVMHLDIKPANLILEAQLGDVRLVDFGTAGVRPPQPAEGGSPTVYGTDGYAPPEQYRGQPVPRSDVFAAAATCYHLLTDDDPREHPFQWPKLGSLPKELSLALQRALRPDPERRSTAAELRLALEALSTPSRTLEAFTFPGNAQIKTVGALPALCDEHWEAARHFLYDGDFVRWLRDLNRHDLAVAADEIVAAEPNRDAGLERFLHIVDPGLPHPQLAVDRPTVDLGGVAREAALIAHVSVTNRGRGYVQVTASADQPWIEIFPATISLWPGRPVDVALTIRAESLPLRHQQQGTVTLSGPDVAPVTVTVLARISVAREVLRVLWRVVSTAAPAAWHEGAEAVTLCRNVTRTLTNPFERHSALLWVLWAILGVATGAGLLYHPEFAAGLPRYGPQIAAWLAEGEWPWNVFLVAAFGPAAALLALWLAFVLGAVLSCSLYGAIRGAWSALMR